MEKPGDSVKGGARYHPILKLTEKWSEFRKAESERAIRSQAERARNDERRVDADLSVRAGEAPPKGG